MEKNKDDRYFFYAILQLEIEATLSNNQTIAKLLRTASDAIELINPSVLQDVKE